MLLKNIVVTGALFAASTAFAQGMNKGQGHGQGKRHAQCAEQTSNCKRSGQGGKGDRMAERLGLSDEQKKQIDAIRSEHRKKVQSGETPHERGAMREDIKKVLTPEQQKLMPETPPHSNAQ